VFEDVHWSDASLLDLIEVLSSRTQDVPVLFVALARPELFTSRPSWGGGLVSATALSLDALAEQDARQLAAQLLAGRVEDGYAERLAASAEGNPLFIEELAAAVAERATADLDTLPTTIRSILEARLDALEPDERAVLLDAAVVGKIFWRGVLDRIGKRGEGLSILLGALEERGMIRREAVSSIQGDQQYTFKHGLMRAVAYATVPRARRRERHGEVARFLEETTTETGESAATLAFHWLRPATPIVPSRTTSWPPSMPVVAGRRSAPSISTTRRSSCCRRGDERRREINVKRAVAIQALFHVPDAARLVARDDEFSVDQ